MDLERKHKHFSIKTLLERIKNLTDKDAEQLKNADKDIGLSPSRCRRRFGFGHYISQSGFFSGESGDVFDGPDDGSY